MTLVLRLAYWFRRIYQFFLRPINIGVRVMLIQDGKVLLVRHVYQRGWFMPGGGMNRKETLEQAARRECREEVGVKMESAELFGIYFNYTEWKSDHIVLFLSEDFTMTDVGDREIAEKKFFPLDALPDGLGRGHRRRLQEYESGVRHVRHGTW
ncbi:MAG TPA: NUDIX domain-containing protein [Anaerolineales bacterium]|nr:NUDIX domain-containing protein [Anaerolineales bacterium]